MFSNKIILNAAAYARYSTDMQTENSIAYQLDAIKKYCNDNHIQLVKVYKDEAYSGTNTNRPGFRAMLADAKQHLFDAVIIYDISRGSRNIADWFEFRNEMAILRIKVISVNQPLGDALDPNNFLVEMINVGLGQHMVLDTRKKSIAGVCAKAREAKFCGGIAPLGYDIVNGDYVINKAEAKLVQTIYTMYAAGKSYDDILKVLKGSKGKLGRPIGKNSLHSILKNERYIGVYTWNKREMKVMGKWAGGKPNPNVIRIEDAIPRIIDDVTWEAVRNRMRQKERCAANKAKTVYLLSGLIECEECGATFVGHRSTNTRGYSSRYYICGNKYRTRTCHSKNISADKIEAFVVQNLKAYLSNADFSETAQIICDKINNTTPNLSEERKELKQVNDKISNGVKAILSGLDLPELKEELDRLRVRKSELEDIIKYNDTHSSAIEPESIIALFKNAVEHIGTDNQAAIKNFITKIYAHADGSATVNIGV
ncbi:MAG: recombinase family protein, partial [bacterium]|nr:recombinase family protein [bacterium]